MKKYIVFALIVLFLFVSCNGNLSDDYEDNKGQTAQNNNEATNSNESNSDNKNIVILSNESAFKVKVYSDSFRNEEVCTLESRENKELKSTDTETVYYITYFVDVGMEVPWYDTNSFCVAKTNETTSISTPLSMTTKNCYCVIENNSTESIIFKRGSSELSPYDSTSSILSNNEKGVYEISYNNFGNFASFSLKTTTGKTIDFPSQITSFESGYIYTITIENNSLFSSIKSITPFNLDTQRQIWGFDDSTFDTNYPIILRNANNVTDGSLIMGTLGNDSKSIGINKIDKYKKAKLTTARITIQDKMIKESRVLDFAQNTDGSIVILLENTTNKKIQALVCYDFSTKTQKWIYEFSGTMLFRADSKNKIIVTPDGKIAIAGAVIADGKMRLYFAVKDSDKMKFYTPQQTYTDYSSGVETAFTSVYYDGTDFYVCGYDNCDFKYSTRKHRGIIYKFSSDLSSVEKIYERENVIFLSIDGIGSDWYVCGEYCDSGNILKGCYLSSSLVNTNSEPIKYATYSTKRSYCYFSQICCYENKIIVSGKASDDFTGNQNALPLIVAFDKNTDTMLWENTSFKNYSDLGSIIPNNINTYIVQLLSSNDVHYVSADLLGNELLSNQ